MLWATPTRTCDERRARSLETVHGWAALPQWALWTICGDVCSVEWSALELATRAHAEQVTAPRHLVLLEMVGLTFLETGGGCRSRHHLCSVAPTTCAAA